MGGDDFQKGHRNLSDEIAEIRNNRINSIKSKQEELDNLRESVLGQEVDYWFEQIRSAILSKIRSEEVSKIVFSGETKFDQYIDNGDRAENPPLRKRVVRIRINSRTADVYHNLTFFNQDKDAVMWKESEEVSGEELYAKDITAMQIHEELMKRLKSEGLDIKSQWTESNTSVKYQEQKGIIHYELQIEINF